MSFAARRRFLWVLFLTGLALLAVIAASGTTLSQLSFDNLAQRSTAVARLRCLAMKSYWEKGEIWTETQFEVIEQFKGPTAGLVTVKLLGGRVGNIDSRVEGVPAFHPGEEVYLFLWGNENKPYRVLGWSQGTFRIAREAQNGMETVRQDSAAMPVFDPQTHASRYLGIRDLPVATFEQKLRQAIAARKR
jgi:hypothetical protein